MGVRRVQRRTVAVVLVAALWAMLPGAASAEQASQGKAAYLRYCSACHGESGKGDGVVSQLMRPKPTDLTVLARNNQGTFPYAQIIQIIDGRQSNRAHGDPDMPVWGEIFRAEAGQTLDQHAVVRGKILLITDYLSSIQQE
jgi:mono/diheme cytochrome c family protein